MRLIPYLLPVGLLLACLASGCASENLEDLSGASLAAPCDPAADVTYALGIRPVIERNHCLECHVTGGIGAINSGFNYETVAGLQAAANSGKLIPSIEHTSAHPMPLGYPMLSPCDIVLIKRWVQAGALDN